MTQNRQDRLVKRHRNNGLRKACTCSRRNWAKCPHSWYLNYKPKGGPGYRFSIDRELGRHVASKNEAQIVAEDLRRAIRSGTFRQETEPQPTAPRTAEAITLADLGKTYFERRGTPSGTGDRYALGRLCAFTPEGQPPLGETAIGTITADVLELFFTNLRQEGRAASTRNHYVQLVRAMFRWAVRKKYIARDPAVDADGIRREKGARRHRRLAPDVVDADGKIVREGEERRLLAVAGPHLQRLIIGALETGCRRGELLNLCWEDVNLERKEIVIRAEHAKTRVGRVLPISSRLAAVLEMARTQLVASLSGKKLTSEELAAAAARSFAFGDAAGFRVKGVKKAWASAVLKAHGHTPKWIATKLAPASRETLRAIDLHLHDLRHEAGSRLHEAGWPLHHVQQMLGHANVSQTSTYLNATRIGLQESMRRFERPLQTVAKTRAIAPLDVCNAQPLPADNYVVN